MKVVGVISSPRINGNTATLVREALKGAAEEGATITEIFLPKYKIEYCKGCSKCISEGKCPIQDDFVAVRDILYDADGIILGSPTYAASMNAIMKTLIERLGLFERMTSSLGGKYVVGISTCNGMGSKKVAKDLTLHVSSGIFKRGYVTGSLGLKFPGGKPASQDAGALQKAGELGRKIVRDIKNTKQYPFQNCIMRLVNYFLLKPMFSKFIYNGREKEMKVIYGNLHQRGLI